MISFNLPISAHTFDIAGMSLEEKIGQLFIAPAYLHDRDALSEGQPKNNRKYIQKLIQQYHLGGVLLKYYWTEEQQKKVIQEFQSLAKIPLFVAQDCEWGVAMRVKEVLPLPKNMGLGAIENMDLLYAVGEEIGRQCRVLGVNFALGPVADVNSNPQNPIIGVRSFGDDPIKVAMKVDAVFKGIQSQSVLACAKHFPGHGDTEKDSHVELPILHHNLKQLKKIHMFPFKQASDGGIQSIMTGHIVVSNVDCNPASLSKNMVSRRLREKIGFDGVVITDDMLMEAVNVPNAVLKAFIAGNDLILSAPNIPEGIEAIKSALSKGLITEEEIDEKVERIFRAKMWMDSELYFESINPEVEALNTCLYEAMMTEVHGPIEVSGNYEFIGSAGCRHLSTLIDTEEGAQKVVVIRSAQDKEVGDIDDSTVVVLLGSPYELIHLPKVPTLVGYDNSLMAQEAVAKVLNGELIPEGKLPIRLPKSSG